MFSSNKISQHNLNSNISHRPTIAQALHSFCMQSRQAIYQKNTYLCKRWQNGTRCRDGVKVLWCHSHLVGLVFRVASLHALVFIQKTFMWLVPADFLFLYCCLGMVRKKRGGRGGRGEDAWSINYDNVHIQLRIIINSNAFKHHTSLSTRVYKPKQSVKPHKTQVKNT